MSPPSVTDNGTTKLTITTAAASANVPPPGQFRAPPGWREIVWVAAILFALLLLLPAKKLRMRLAFGVLALALLLGSLVGCGGGSSPTGSHGIPGTPLGTYTVWVTGDAGGGLTHSVSLTVSVQ